MSKDHGMPRRMVYMRTRPLLFKDLPWSEYVIERKGREPSSAIGCVLRSTARMLLCLRLHYDMRWAIMACKRLVHNKREIWVGVYGTWMRFKDLELVWSKLFEMIGHVPIGVKLFGLDGWEVRCSCMMILSLQNSVLALEWANFCMWE